MKISYSILVHNETESLERLIDFLVANKDDEDEIVILDDFSDDEQTRKIIDTSVSVYDIKFEQRALLGDFASQKNHLKNMCTGDYIFNLDADELPHKFLMKNVKAILEANPTIDLFWVPRVNTVEGITQEHIQKWGWNVNEKNWVNFPDYQGRIWKNRPNIMWKNKVHEVLTGYNDHSYLPAEEEFSFYHPKDIDRQEQQNALYDTINFPSKPLRSKGYNKIRVFTTFAGFDYENNIIQRNAFDSWKRLNLDVYVFSVDEKVRDICEKENFTFVNEFLKTEENDLPILKSMISIMASKIDNEDIMVYLNSDIILDDGFINSLDFISNSTEKQFLAVSQRFDWQWDKVSRVDANNIDFEKIQSEGKLHLPGGLDCFAFTKYFYDVSEIPNFIVPRGRFDHWLMGKALSSDLPVFDFTDVYTLIHQDNPPEKVHDGDFTRPDCEPVLAKQLRHNVILFEDDKLHGETDMGRYRIVRNNSGIELEERTEGKKNEFGNIKMGGTL
ncbi:MAG: hypothetical protein CMB78_06300 [Euryarchaeota archaeon]|nr:hypothetical protein [Euryarchaeota archaeon]